MRKTKIICTIGPSSNNSQTLKDLVLAGMDAARLNFSHGTHSEHLKVLEGLRKISQGLNKPIAVIQDLCGPKVRIGDLKNSQAKLIAGNIFILKAQEILGDENMASIFPQSIIFDLKIGNKILIDDGLIELEIIKIKEEEIYTKVIIGGDLFPHKGVNFPKTTLNLPSLTEKDYQDLEFALNYKVDFIALSFIREASNVLKLKEYLFKKNSKISIISKIEKHEAIKNIDEIIQVSDAIMVARGDLGIELSLEEVPFWQKEIIKRCNFYSKPVITATQMLESMINNFRPTRAEVADIANAIIDGTDALMLSGETAKGKYPVETVKIMHKTALIAENTLNYENILTQKVSNKNVSEAISLATCEIAEISDAKAILTFTSSGRTAKKISRYKPRAIILAAVNSEDVQRQLNLSWGVYSFLTPQAENSDELIKKTAQKIQKENLVKQGDLAVITAGIPHGVPGSTNMIKLHVMGHVFLRGMGAGKKSIISGRTCILKNFENLYSQIEEGDILVAPYLDKKLEVIMSKIKGAIIQTQETSSQISLIEKYNLGAVFGVPDALEVFKDGRIITLDIVRGLIYEAD